MNIYMYLSGRSVNIYSAEECEMSTGFGLNVRPDLVSF